MAIKPQLIAATFVALISSTAAAQQFGPPMGNQFGPRPGSQQQMMSPQMSPQQMYAPGQTAFASPAENPQGYNPSPGAPLTMRGAPGPGFGPAGMQQQDGIQLVSASAPNPAPSQNMPGAAAPNGAPMYMDPGNAVYQQGGPAGIDNGMPCGQCGPGYPGMQQPGMGPGPNGCGCGSFAAPEPTTPRWYFRGEVVWLMRNNPNDRNLTTYNNLSNDKDRLNNRFLLNTDDVDFGLVPGMRLTLGHYLTDRTAIEGAFYGTNNWDERNGTPQFPSANGAGPLSPYWGNGGGPFNTAAFSNSNQQIASYQSSFDSAELGIRQWITPTMSVLLGFRFINVGDQFQLTATNNATNEDVGREGFYRTWTTNNLIGLQFGTEYTHELFFRWLYFSVECKGGAFLNFADQKNLLFNTGTTYDQRSARDTQFSSMLDLSVAVSALVGNHLTLRGGYTFLFLDGIALATDQLDTNPTMTNSRDFIADKGAMTLQGPFVGGEIAW
jgi:hypothetical protein